MRYRSLVLALVLAPAAVAGSGVAQTAAGEGGDDAGFPEPLSWGRRMADSEMSRRGDSLFFRKGSRARWNYENGVFFKGLLSLAEQTRDARYSDYVKRAVDSYVQADGTIETYDPEEFNLDQINTGKVVLAFYEKTGEDRYRSAAFLLMKQLDSHPRTSEGGFWHKKIYPYQMWLDGIYMAGPFYAQFSRLFSRPAGFDDVAHQVSLIEKHARDPKTGLLYHGWDEKREQLWANPETGCSPNFWSRSLGWYAMALVDVLDYLPPNHPGRATVASALEKTLRAVCNYQDAETGLWYQVTDQGARKGNYLEASGSCMFVYAIAKGVRNGYLGKDFIGNARRGWAGIVGRLVKQEQDGSVSLTNVCSVAGLGGPAKRNGSFEYYIGEPVVSNDLKGIGPFIMAAVDASRLPRVER